MDKQEEDESDGEPPAPELHVDPDHQQHRAAGLQQDGKKLQQRQQDEFQLCEKLCDEDPNDSKRG